MVAKSFKFILIIALVLLLFISVIDAKKAKGGMGGMGGGGPFGNKKMQMVFITVREGYLDPKGIEKMAKDF